MDGKGRFYNWMFTAFANDNGILEINKKIFQEKLVFMVYQEEECPSTKKRHLQGYAEFTEKVSMKYIKELMVDPKVHLEPRKGTQQQAIDYCTKEETRVPDSKPTFYGRRKSPGNRSDLDSMVDAIENGATSKEILMQFRGNALRHFGMIIKGLTSFHDLEIIDSVIKEKRKITIVSDEEAQEVLSIENA